MSYAIRFRYPPAIEAALGVKLPPRFLSDEEHGSLTDCRSDLWTHGSKKQAEMVMLGSDGVRGILDSQREAGRPVVMSVVTLAEAKRDLATPEPRPLSPLDAYALLTDKERALLARHKAKRLETSR